MAPGQEADGDINLGNLFELLYNNGMLSILIRKRYTFMIR